MPETPADSSQTAERKPEARSRVGNGKTLFLGTADGEPIDGRTLPARVFRDLLAEIVGDLGGRAALSEAEFQLCRRAAALGVECLIAESKQAAGHGLDLETFTSATNTQRRVLVTLGLKRRAKNITPHPLDYIEAKAEGGAA